jgi:hypothetical protein
MGDDLGGGVENGGGGETETQDEQAPKPAEPTKQRGTHVYRGR